MVFSEADSHASPELAEWMGNGGKQLDFSEIQFAG